MLRAVSLPPRLAGPVTLGAAALVGTALVALVDPGQPGHYPSCPFLVLTGWYCPGCGGLRAVHALTHGDLATAVDRNALLVALLPLAVPAYLWWLRRSWQAPLPRAAARALPPGVRYWTAGVAWIVLVVFGVLRNLPAGAWLAP